MCDYSLHSVTSRPAKAGDKVVTARFTNSATRGFAPVDEPNIAVCLLPGTELAFEKDAECDRSLGFLPNRKLGQRVARFRQVNVNQPNVHHDALEFPNGQVVLVTRLCQGQRATVLQLPASAGSARPTTEAYRTISTTLQRSVDRDGASGPEQSEVAHRKVQGTIVYRRNNSQFITAG
jgi:hypothetical protein